MNFLFYLLKKKSRIKKKREKTSKVEEYFSLSVTYCGKEKRMDHILDYSTPAVEWIEGLPTGNGTIGCMLWGEAGKEVLTLNHERLFRNNLKKTLHTSQFIPKVRKLVLEGKGLEAQQFFNAQLADQPRNINPYQVFAEVKLKVEGAELAIGYSRALDLKNGVATVGYTSGGIRYRLTCFTSSVHQLLVTRLETENAMPFLLKLRFDRPEDPDCTWTSFLEGKNLVFKACFKENVQFSSIVGLETQGGEIGYEDGWVTLKNISGVTLYQTLATSYESQDPYAACKSGLVAVKRLSYAELLSTHKAENRKMYSRVLMSLGDADTSATMEQLYDRMFTEPKIDNSVYTRLFEAARYYTMCSSRPGGVPMNLQGIWNDRVYPMWESSYVTDLNIQMHYWMSLGANLAECQQPFFDWLESHAEKLKKYAMEVYGCRGYFVPQYADIHMECALQEGCAAFQVLWSGSAAWLAQHYYEYWRYTCDDHFACESAIPYHIQVAAFYRDLVTKDADGKYRICPSLAPENTTTKGTWLVDSSTIDLSLIHEVMTHLFEMLDECSVDCELRSEFEEIDQNLVDYPIDSMGYLREWVEDSVESDPYHRHLSPIYNLSPGKLFLENEDKTLYNAAVKAVERRQSGGYGSCAGWSHAWYACCYARMQKGNKALECLDNMLKSTTVSNFLTTANDWRGTEMAAVWCDYRLLQIDALLAAGNAVLEMLLQSYNQGLKVLPALPDSWAEGRVMGLRAYHGFELDVEWSGGKLCRLVVRCLHANECKLIFCVPFAGNTAILRSREGNILAENVGQNLSFYAEKGMEYELLVE